MASYREIYDRARQELQDTKNREDLVDVLHSWRSEYKAMLIGLEESKESNVSCDQDFLNNAKIFIDGTNSSTVWLFDPKVQIATHCELSSFTRGDFSASESPNNELYQDFMQLLTREFPCFGASPYITAKMQEVAFVDQGSHTTTAIKCYVVRSVGQ